MSPRAREDLRFEPAGGVSGAGRARPRGGEVDEARGLEDRATGGHRVDDQVAGAERFGLAGAGGDDCAVKSTAAMGFERPPSVESAEGAERVGVKAADADGDIVRHRNEPQM